MNKESLKQFHDDLGFLKQQLANSLLLASQKEKEFKKGLEGFFKTKLLPDFINIEHLDIEAIWNYSVNVNIEPKYFFRQIIQALRHIKQTQRQQENTYDFEETETRVTLPYNYPLQSFNPVINYLVAIRYLKWQVDCEGDGRRDARFDKDARKYLTRAKEILEAQDPICQRPEVQNKIKVYTWMESHTETLIDVFFEGG